MSYNYRVTLRPVSDEDFELEMYEDGVEELNRENIVLTELDRISVTASQRWLKARQCGTGLCSRIELQ